MPEEVAFWKGSHHIVVYEFEYFFLLGVLLQTGVLYVRVDHDKVFFAFAGEGGRLVFAVGGHVLEQEFPDFASVGCL